MSHIDTLKFDLFKELLDTVSGEVKKAVIHSHFPDFASSSQSFFPRSIMESENEDSSPDNSAFYNRRASTLLPVKKIDETERRFKNF